MIAHLANANESITAVLSGAITTANPKCIALVNVKGNMRELVSSLNGVAAVTVVPAPSEGETQIDSINIYNADSVAVVVTLSKVVSGTSYSYYKATLQSGETLRMDASGVYLIST